MKSLVPCVWEPTGEWGAVFRRLVTMIVAYVVWFTAGSGDNNIAYYSTSKKNIKVLKSIINICRESVHVTNLKKRRSLNFLTELSCCNFVKSISKKDVLVRNPQKLHFSKKIIVGEPFRKLLKAIYRDHPKAAQEINGKFQLDNAGGDEGDKVSIYNIEDKSDAAKNKTITELRGAILKLLDKLRKKAKPQGTKNIEHQEHKVNKHEVPHKLPEVSNVSKTAKTKYNTMASSTDAEISAKRANELDLLNFISRMKSVEGIRDEDSNKRRLFETMNGMPMNEMPIMNGMPMNEMPMNGMPMNGMPINGISNAPDMLSPSLMNNMYAQGQNDFLPGNGLQGRELEEQRKRIEDQMDNNLAQLQIKFKLLEQQQEAGQMQNLQNDQIPQGYQYDTASPPVGITGGFNNQAQPLHLVNPYLFMNRARPRFRTRVPFLPPLNPSIRSPFYHEDVNDMNDDNADDDDERYHDEPPARYPVHEDEDADDEDDEEEHYGPDDER